jgi:Tol biopolymer transport system component
LAGTNPHKLTTGTCPTNNDPCDNVDADGDVINTATDAGAPAWSPKGNQVILGVKYVNPIIFWSGVQGDRGQIWIMDSDGNNRTQLTMPTKPPPGEPYPNNDDPGWSPDGTLILFSTNRNDGKPEMWRMGANGSSQQRIVNNTFGPLPGDAAWQPVP